MKCSDCELCQPSGDFFKCTNRQAEGYGLEIFNPNNAGCKDGSTLNTNSVEEVIHDANLL